MDKKTLYAIGAFGAVIILACIVVNMMPKYDEMITFDMYLTVGEVSAFNTDTDAVRFGTIIPSGAGKRFIIVNNIANATRRVHFEATGQLLPWMVLPEDSFLDSVASRNYTIQVKVPSDALYGDYTGNLLIKMAN